MKLEHLRDTLVNKRLFLGDPETWDDKNDAKLMKMYKKSKGYETLRATCLTASADRFHFWDIFAGKEKGVCLWFNPKGLIADIEEISSLCVRKVGYYTPKALEGKTLEDLPFSKRVQYADEREYRVLNCNENGDVASIWFEFPEGSLKRIYLNPWLTSESGEVGMWKGAISEWISDYPKDVVTIKQNKTIDHPEWVRAAEGIAKTSKCRNKGRA